MAKKKKGSFSGIMGLIVTAVIVSFIALGAIMAIARNAGVTKVTDFAIVYDNQYYMSDAGGFAFEKGDELEVKFFKEAKEFSVQVYAIENDEGSFAFKTGDSETVYTWNDAIAPRDITQHFLLDVKQAKDGKDGKIGKIVFLSDVTDIIEACAGEKVNYTAADYAGDFFQLVITVDKQVLKIEFTVINNEVDFIILDKQEIVFNK